MLSYLTITFLKARLVQIVDAVTNACGQICEHLGDELYDLVLQQVYDYASSNVRPNAVWAM